MNKMTEQEKIDRAIERKSLPTGLSKNDNVNYVLHNLDLMTFAPIDCKVDSSSIIEGRCYDYLEKCITNEMKPSLAGLALAIGVGRETLIKYINGNTDIPWENRSVLQRYYTLLNSLMEDYVQNGKINPVPALFLLKNNFGYKDTQEFVVNNNVQEESSPESLIEEANLLLETDGKLANIED